MHSVIEFIDWSNGVQWGVGTEKSLTAKPIPVLVVPPKLKEDNHFHKQCQERSKQELSPQQNCMINHAMAIRGFKEENYQILHHVLLTVANDTDGLTGIQIETEREYMQSPEMVDTVVVQTHEAKGSAANMEMEMKSQDTMKKY